MLDKPIATLPIGRLLTSSWCTLVIILVVVVLILIALLMAFVVATLMLVRVAGISVVVAAEFV